MDPLPVFPPPPAWCPKAYIFDGGGSFGAMVPHDDGFRLIAVYPKATKQWRARGIHEQRFYIIGGIGGKTVDPYDPDKHILRGPEMPRLNDKGETDAHH